MKQVVVLVGAGSIGIAIARRVSAGKRLVIADYSFENAKQAAQMLDNAGFECTPVEADLGSKESFLGLVNKATALGEVVNLINAAGVSPSQAPVERILQVDLYGTSVLLDEFGKVIGEGGSGGALALAVANRVGMQEHAVYSVLSPEGFASILWKDRSRAADAAASMRMNADQVRAMGVVDDVLSEGDEPAHVNPSQACEVLRGYLVDTLDSFAEVDPEELVRQRHERFARY